MSIKPRTEVIREYMREHNIGNNQMANRMKIDKAFLSRVLRNVQQPGPKFINSLMRVTGKSFDDLFLPSSLSNDNEEEAEQNAS